METTSQFWRVCSTCKKQIKFQSKYYECNVSTCTGKRSGYVFCSVPCFEAHIPGAKHRDAWAIEKISSSFSESQGGTMQTTNKPDTEILVVVSKMKQYIKDKADMNTSGDVADILSAMIRSACDMAIQKARTGGRKTVMGKDF